MRLPFTTDQFLDIFRQYNEGVYPAQAILFLAGILAVYFAYRPSASGGRLISGFLSGLWIWMGVAYHLAHFSRINPAAFVFGAGFIFQGLLFARYATRKHPLTFRMQGNLNSRIAWVVLTYALIVYPALGTRFGHHYPSAPTFGLPCPTTIFTFGMLLLCERRCPPLLLIVPFAWSVVGGAAAVQLGMTEDFALPVTGLLVLGLVLRHNRKLAAVA